MPDGPRLVMPKPLALRGLCNVPPGVIGFAQAVVPTRDLSVIGSGVVQGADLVHSAAVAMLARAWHANRIGRVGV
jgi:hypothetical protein